MTRSVEGAMQDPAGPFIYIAYDAEGGCWRGIGFGDTLAEQARHEVEARQKMIARARGEDLLCARFKNRGNPLDAWRWLSSLRPGEPVPDAVRRYLVRTASAIARLEAEFRDRKKSAKDCNEALAAILDFARANGGPSVWRDSEDANDEQSMSFDANFFSGPKVSDQMAFEYGISRKTVDKKIKRARSELDADK